MLTETFQIIGRCLHVARHCLAQYLWSATLTTAVFFKETCTPEDVSTWSATAWRNTVGQHFQRRRQRARLGLNNFFLFLIIFSFKGQCHEIFDPQLFSSNNPLWALIHGLKPFRIWLRIRRENQVGNHQNWLPRSDGGRGSRLFFLLEFPFNIYVFL
jgi:hypothetical protein